MVDDHLMRGNKYGHSDSSSPSFSNLRQPPVLSLVSDYANTGTGRGGGGGGGGHYEAPADRPKKSKLSGKHPLMRERLASKGLAPGAGSSNDDRYVTSAVEKYKHFTQHERQEAEDNDRSYYQSDYGYNSQSHGGGGGGGGGSSSGGRFSSSSFSSSSAAPAKAARHLKTQLIPANVAKNSKALGQTQQEAKRAEPVKVRVLSFDDLQRTVLRWEAGELDGSVRARLKSEARPLPETFQSEQHYQSAFYPLLLEEFRAAVLSQLDEVRALQRERRLQRANRRGGDGDGGDDDGGVEYHGMAEVLIIEEYMQTDQFYEIKLRRLEVAGAGRQGDSGPPLFSDQEFVLLWFRDAASSKPGRMVVNEFDTQLSVFAHLDRLKEAVDPAAPPSRGVRYRARVNFDNSTARGQQIQRSLLPRNHQWGAISAGSLKTMYREFAALQHCGSIDLFQRLLKPQPHNGDPQAANAMPSVDYSLSPSSASLNPSQRQAIDAALANSFGFTLIEGPPGTGKTKTVVSLVDLLLIQTRQLHARLAAAAPPAPRGRPKASASSSSPPLGPLAPAFPAPRLLLCAPSNAAIDELVRRLLIARQEGLLSESWTIIRVGVGAGRHDKRGAEEPTQAAAAAADGLNASEFLQDEGARALAAIDIQQVNIERLVDAQIEEPNSNNNNTDNPPASSIAGAPALKDRVKSAKRSLGGLKQQIDAANEGLKRVHEQIQEIETAPPEGDRGKREDKEEGEVVGDAINGPGPDSATGGRVETREEHLKSLYSMRSLLQQELTGLHHDKRAAVDSLQSAQEAANRSKATSADHRESVRSAIFDSAHIVCTTLSGAGMELFSQSARPFEVVIIDEAAQSLEPTSLIPLRYRCKRLVLVGDPNQLPATVMSQLASELAYKQSLFQRLQTRGVPVHMLAIQYRMHREIRLFPSLFFYEDRLRDAASLVQSPVFTNNPAIQQTTHNTAHNSVSAGHAEAQSQALSATKPSFSQDLRLGPYVLFDLAEGSESKANRSSLRNVAEARFIVELFAFLVHALAAGEDKKKGGSASGASPYRPSILSRIGILSPYRQQIHEIRRLLDRALESSASSFQGLDALRAAVEVATVDSFQGREKDFIIFSAVRAQPYRVAAANHSTNNAIGFVADCSRLNVALTRSRMGFFLVGHFATLTTNAMWHALVENAKQRNTLIHVANGQTKRMFMKQPFMDPQYTRPWTSGQTSKQQQTARASANAPAAEGGHGEKRPVATTEAAGSATQPAKKMKTATNSPPSHAPQPRTGIIRPTNIPPAPRPVHPTSSYSSSSSRPASSSAPHSAAAAPSSSSSARPAPAKPAMKTWKLDAILGSMGGPTESS